MSTYLDACERCARHDVVPAAAIADGDNGIVCGYRCPTCRAAWTCSWSIDPSKVIPLAPTPALDPHVSALLHEQAAINRAHKHTARRDPA